MGSHEPVETLLSVNLNGEQIATISAADVPCELTPSRQIEQGAIVDFVTASGDRHTHSLGELSGWVHLSIRVHAGLACQADCAVTSSQIYDQRNLMDGSGSGVRFQPFFLPGSKGSPEELRGKGLFQRGLHFSGTVTPSSVRLSCECDDCHRTFHVQSFHAGFSNVEYMYSRSGRFTLVIDSSVPGTPGALGVPDPEGLRLLESSLPSAPDGTDFKYLNPFRCPHCHSPYIDFERFPEQRPGEYYGNSLFDTALLHYPSAENAPAVAPRKSWLKRIFS